MPLPQNKLQKLVERLNPEVSELLQRNRSKIKPASASVATSGDILLFLYDNMYRLVLVVSNLKGNGLFTSTRGNKLVSAFEIDVNVEILEIILKKLYKNRITSNYRNITASLRVILGRDRYRTYNLSKMRNIYNLTLEL